MKKRILIIALTVTLMLSIIPMMPHQYNSVQAASSGEVIKGVNFRSQPSTNSSVIRMLQKGEQVSILEKVNSYWYKARDRNGRVGYVSTQSQYIKVSSQSNSSATIVSSVSFRTGPSTSNSRIRYLQRGETVSILETVNSYWYKVRDRNGRVGYVSTSSKYISTSGGTSHPSNGSGTSQSDASATIEKVISSGRSYLGTPYEFGSNRSSTRTFDCSAFVRRAFIEGAGVTLPMDSRQQGDYVKKKGKTTTNWRNLKRGDLMFFMAYKGTAKSNYSNINKSSQRITHVGIYLGNGQILHTYSKDSGGVRVDNIANRHWEYRFMFGGSAL